MNGIKYYRIKKCLTQRELAKRAGVSIATINSMEQMTQPRGIYGYNYLRVQHVLEVTIDELIRNDFPDSEDGGPSSIPYPSRTENQYNCITIYRRNHHLTFDALAPRMGVTTRECARKACAAENPLKKHIRALAACEGISADEFIEKYSSNGAAA